MTAQFRPFYLVILSLIAISNVSCLNHVDANLKKSLALSSTNGTTTSPPVSYLTWNYLNLTVMPGEQIPFAITDGTPAYITSANGIGTFDSTTLIYVAPMNTVSTTHTIGISDANSKTGTNTFKIAGFVESKKIQYPLSFGDQNYVTSSVVTTNGNIFVSSIVSDSPGWERWVIFKSTDLGSTWSQVDQYVPYEDGESHPLSLLSKGNDVFACGYIWGGAIYSSEWVVRKSSDGGATWSTQDQYAINAGQNHVCFDIDQDTTTGNLFTVGYDSSGAGNRAVVRESTDDGATWTTIETVAGKIFVSVKVSPLGVVWAIADDGVLYKGTYSLGSWSWASAGTLADGGTQNGTYELQGDLELVDELTAFYSYKSSKWFVEKTTDGGVTWTTSFTGPANSIGQDIKKLSNGDLVTLGADYSTNPKTVLIKRSTDNGTTWNTVFSNNTTNREGVSLVEANDSSVLAFVAQTSSPYQILNYRSTDSGATWASRSTIYFKQSLYTDYKDFLRDSAGNFWATGYISYIDATNRPPWVVLKSSDKGTTWTQSDVFTVAGHSIASESIASSSTGDIYVSGFDDTNKFILRKSSDSGATWNQVDSNSPAGATYAYASLVTVATNGDVFYSGVSALGGADSSAEIRKGTANGTSWSTIKTFPILAGSKQFNLTFLKSFSDGSLWVGGTEANAANTTQAVAYRSTDGGTTFVEKYRVSNVSMDLINRASNGDIYLGADSDIYKSTDNGTTWTIFYSKASFGMVKSFELDSSDKMFIVTASKKVVTKNQFDNSWFSTYDYTLPTPNYSRYLYGLKKCSGLAELCLIGTYTKSIDGSVITLLPLVVP